jgi:hypothetical protein
MFYKDQQEKPLRNNDATEIHSNSIKNAYTVPNS